MVLAVIAAGCSSGETLTAEPEPSPLAAPVTVTQEPETTAAPPVVETVDVEASELEPIEIAMAGSGDNPSVLSLPDPVAIESEATPTPTQLTLPTVAFPDDIALLTEHYHVVPKDGPLADDVERIYWRNGRLTRETIIPAIAPVADGGYNLHMVFRPDGFSAIMTVCLAGYCASHLGLFDDEPPGHTALYESQDGGITWEKLVAFDLPWVATQFLPAGEGETRLLLRAYRGFFKDINGNYTKRPADMVWTSSDGIGELPAPGGEIEGEGCLWCLKLPDGRLLLTQDYKAEELIGPRGAAEGRVVYFDIGLPWPTIRDPERGEQWPIWMPPDVLRAEESLWPLAIQQGPFLRVADDLEGCLPVLADPSPDAEELSCMAARVLLQDQGETSEIEGAAWHRVRTPAGIEGWADGRNLQ